MTKMEANLRSKEVIKTLLEAFLSSADRLSVQSIREEPGGGGARPDFVALIRSLPKRNDAWQLLIEAKSRGEPYFLRIAADQLASATEQWIRTKARGNQSARVASLVIVPFVSEAGRQLLLDRRINYLDLAGNGRLSLGDFFVERTGNRGDPRLERRARRVFQGKSLAITRALLSEPTRKWTLSSLAKTADVSLGYAHSIVRRLTEDSLVTLTAKRRLEVPRPGALLDAWAKARTLDMDEKLSYFSFDRSLPTIEQKVDEAASRMEIKYAFTLGAGANRRAPFARYPDVQLYVRAQDADRLAKALDLRPTEAGANVVLRLTKDDGVFFGSTAAEGATVVSDVQLYVDLFNYPARGRESAEALRERRLSALEDRP